MHLAGRQAGNFLIIFALLLSGLVAALGLALDVARVVARQAELRGLADAIVLAAARQLNGTATGVQAAAASAATAAAANPYGNGLASASGVAAALRLAATPDAADDGWLDVAAATAAPAGLWYARVDTAALDSAVARLDLLVLSGLNGGAGVGAVHAVAGRTGVNITPLAICAMSSSAAGSMTHGSLVELLEYGFRRGVGYNLLNLNPNGATPANYLVNPIDAPAAAPASAVNLAPAVMNAFMCSGTLALPQLPSSVYISALAVGGFAYSKQLNARFDDFTGSDACSPVTAPPDRNIWQYTPASTGWWSSANKPLGQTAASTTGTPLRTIADLASLTGYTVTAGSYGPLWAYGQPVRAGSGVAFAVADWATLYPVSSGAAPASSGYPGSGVTPYTRTSSNFFTAPTSHTGVAQRRVLNVPLLACPVSGNTATVLAVGRFLLTAQASAAAVSGEFIGLLAATAQTGPVGLLQ